MGQVGNYHCQTQSMNINQIQLKRGIKQDIKNSKGILLLRYIALLSGSMPIPDRQKGHLVDEQSLETREQVYLA